ncbi:hypothetical protein [Nannocystis pusilla]|uniref:hypothetical protein n=1 Tax=Nannocystis pusilla TaxID=889268 RepID=UPI003B7DA848
MFERKGGTWSQIAYVKALNTQPLAEFGAALALSAAGDTLVVGAPARATRPRGRRRPVAGACRQGRRGLCLFEREW